MWLDAAELKKLAGWELKPEGICRGDLCVPIPPGRESEFTSKHDGATWLNFSALADQMGKPWAGDAKNRVWYFGAEAADRGNALRTLEAPDFELPDLDGKTASPVGLSRPESIFTRLGLVVRMLP